MTLSLNSNEFYQTHSVYSDIKQRKSSKTSHLGSWNQRMMMFLLWINSLTKISPHHPFTSYSGADLFSFFYQLNGTKWTFRARLFSKQLLGSPRMNQWIVSAILPLFSLCCAKCVDFLFLLLISLVTYSYSCFNT